MWKFTWALLPNLALWRDAGCHCPAEHGEEKRHSPWHGFGASSCPSPVPRSLPCSLLQRFVRLPVCCNPPESFSIFQRGRNTHTPQTCICVFMVMHNSERAREWAWAMAQPTLHRHFKVLRGCSPCIPSTASGELCASPVGTA